MVATARFRLLGELTKDLAQQICETYLVLDQRHFRLLLNLSAVEKETLAKVVIEWNWNVGSPIVMRFLQKANILNMSEAIVFSYNQNPEVAQLIFNDLLETEYILLADLLKHANSTDPSGLSLSDLLNEGFKRLCNDVIENPTIMIKNYLVEVQRYLLDDCIEETRKMHLNLLMQGEKQLTVDAFSNQYAWNKEVTDEHTVFKSFLSSIVGCDFQMRRNTFVSIFEKCAHWEEQNWKNLLLLLRIVIDANEYVKFSCDERNDFKAIAKKFLKDTFRRSVDDEDENGFYVLFIVARQITRYNESLLGNYAIWFKDAIGEMKYFLKAAEFILTMQQLAGMVQLECDLDVLDVHITTYMPAPTRCNELVLNYKQLCRSRQAHLKMKPKSGIEAVREEDADVFLIDDED